MNQWTVHLSNDGKTFYYNNETKQSVWDKPEELKTEKEVKNIQKLVIFEEIVRVMSMERI